MSDREPDGRKAVPKAPEPDGPRDGTPGGVPDEALEPTPVGELLARVTARAPRRPSKRSTADRPEAREMPSAPEPAEDARTRRVRAVDPAALRDVRRAVGEGWDPILVLGARGTGKSTFLAAAGRSPRGVLGAQPGGAAAAPLSVAEPGRLASVPLRRGRRRRWMVEPPGGDVDGEAAAIVRELAPRLRGVVVLVDLEPVLRRDDAAALAGLQRALLTLRWRRGPGSGAGAAPSVEEMARQLAAAPPWAGARIGFPVAVLFSRADRLVGLPVADHRPGLFPAGEDPLLFVWHRLPLLVEMLGEHCRRFRFDFVHCRAGDDDERPCGLVPALDWILVESGRFRGPSPSTAAWIRCLRWWDRQRGRASRWRRLPPPRPLL